MWAASDLPLALLSGAWLSAQVGFMVLSNLVMVSIAGAWPQWGAGLYDFETLER